MNKPLVLGVDILKGVLLYHSYDVSCGVKDPSKQTCYNSLKLCLGSWSPKLSKKRSSPDPARKGFEAASLRDHSRTRRSLKSFVRVPRQVQRTCCDEALKSLSAIRLDEYGYEPLAGVTF